MLAAARARCPPPRELAWGGLALGVALVSAAITWGFTIDDALISVRYAAHLASGEGYRFNAGGAPTDGVTPLLWPFVLAPFAGRDLLVTLVRAKILGLVAWSFAAFAWGAAIGRTTASRGVRLLALAGLGASLPVAAHAVSGMETALAMALSTVASLWVSRPRLSSALAGLVAAFRPEMVVWALILGVFRARLWGLVAAVPFVVCAAVRAMAFGHLAPLAVLAKPSDLPHGIAYASAASLVSVGPLLACAPVAAVRARNGALPLVVAGAGHLLAVAMAGGDWMPFARLVAPVVPSLIFASVLLAAASRAGWTALRGGAALLLGGYVLAGEAAAHGRRVGDQQRALVLAVSPRLAKARTVAALDIGWVGAAAPGARIVDLAGLTDETIASLRGGHTSKRIDPAFLLARDPDWLVLYTDAFASLRGLDDPALFTAEPYPRVVEARLARSELVQRHFAASALVPYGSGGAGYVLMQKRAP